MPGNTIEIQRLHKARTAATCLALALGSALAIAQTSSAKAVPPALVLRSYPIQSEERKALARTYSIIHYGIDEWRLLEPRLIIVHYTGSDSDKESLAVFKQAALGDTRPDIIAGGALNVGIHYEIQKDGTIYSLLPESDMARHAVGYNYTAIGIEMTGASAASLSDAELRSCAALVADIARRRPSIEYLCGHHEYVQPYRAHFILYRELIKAYQPPAKVDPGDAFMARLRKSLTSDYGLELKD